MQVSVGVAKVQLPRSEVVPGRSGSCIGYGPVELAPAMVSARVTPEAAAAPVLVTVIRKATAWSVATDAGVEMTVTVTGLDAATEVGMETAVNPSAATVVARKVAATSRGRDVRHREPAGEDRSRARPGPAPSF